MMMCAPASRRQLFLAAAAGAAFSGACGRARRRQPGRLTYLLPTEPDTLDPAKSPGGSEVWIMSALFEPLLQPHPETAAPIAGLATHYKVERGGTRYTFYLRGHPAPEGIRLPGTESLPAEFSRERVRRRRTMSLRAGVMERHSPRTTSSIPGAGISRRKPAIRTRTVFIASLEPKRSAAGRFRQRSLGCAPLTHSPSRWIFTRRRPTSSCCAAPGMTLPLPRHAIEAARRRGREASWTEPGRMVTSGPFVLKESRPRERIVIARNPNYFDADVVGVEEIRVFRRRRSHCAEPLRGGHGGLHGWPRAASPVRSPHAQQAGVSYEAGLRVATIGASARSARRWTISCFAMR